MSQKFNQSRNDKSSKTTILDEEEDYVSHYSSVGSERFGLSKTKRRRRNKSVKRDSVENMDSIERMQFRKGIYDMARSSFNDIIDAEQVEEMREAFNILDEDYDGLITTKEFKHIVRGLGVYISEPQLQRLVQELDIDGIGYIDFSEYIYFISVYDMEDPEFSEKDLYDAFKVFDPTSVGSISMGDMRFALVQLGDKFTYEDVENFVKDAKPNEEYRVEYADFCQLLTRL